MLYYLMPLVLDQSKEFLANRMDKHYGLSSQLSRLLYIAIVIIPCQLVSAQLDPPKLPQAQFNPPNVNYPINTGNNQPGNFTQPRPANNGITSVIQEPFRADLSQNTAELQQKMKLSRTRVKKHHNHHHHFHSHHDAHKDNNNINVHNNIKHIDKVPQRLSQISAAEIESTAIELNSKEEDKESASPDIPGHIMESPQHPLQQRLELPRKPSGTLLQTPSQSNSPTRPTTAKAPSTTTLRKRQSSSHLSIMNSFRQDLSFPYRMAGMDLIDTVRTTYPFIYRINDGTSNNIVLQQVCEERGWQEFKDLDKSSLKEREIHDNIRWNLWWSYNFYQGLSSHRTLKCWQYTNHNPRAFQFCNKSYLTSFLRKMFLEHGEPFNFSPISFAMPVDFVRLVHEHRRRQECKCPDARNIISIKIDDSPDHSVHPFFYNQKKTVECPVWISKPVGKSQGKGIFLTTDVSIIAHSPRSVVQEYISRPLLIGGYKWDIRIYVCVASTDPLVIYIYKEGLCRFATDKYDVTNLTANFSHLTNASLNKMGPDYPTEKDVIGSGCKWSLRQLRAHFKANGISDWYMWQKIMSMIVLTVVGEALRSGYTYPANRNCFDFFGFDILVDDKMRPYLLEVNYSPGLGGDCIVDEIVKKPMLHELFDMFGFPRDIPTAENSQKVPSEHPNSTTTQSKKSPSSKPTQLQSSVDCSCKGRLKNAAEIYSQDLMTEYLIQQSKKSSTGMTRVMKALLAKKIQAKRAKKGLNDGSSTSTEKLEKTPSKTTPDCNNNTPSSDKISDEPPPQPPPPPTPIPHPRPGTSVLKNGFMATITSSGVVTSFLQSGQDRPDPTSEEGGPYIYLQRHDWMEPPKTRGSWVLVYPCKAYPYKSPYRSSLSDLRGIVKTIDNYLQISSFIFRTYPNSTDKFYKDRIKALCRWDIDVWIPPSDADPQANEYLIFSNNYGKNKEEPDQDADP